MVSVVWCVGAGNSDRRLVKPHLQIASQRHTRPRLQLWFQHFIPVIGSYWCYCPILPLNWQVHTTYSQSLTYPIWSVAVSLNCALYCAIALNRVLNAKRMLLSTADPFLRELPSAQISRMSNMGFCTSSRSSKTVLFYVVLVWPVCGGTWTWFRTMAMIKTVQSPRTAFPARTGTRIHIDLLWIMRLFPVHTGRLQSGRRCPWPMACWHGRWLPHTVVPHGRLWANLANCFWLKLVYGRVYGSKGKTFPPDSLCKICARSPSN